MFFMLSFLHLCAYHCSFAWSRLVPSMFSVNCWSSGVGPGRLRGQFVNLWSWLIGSAINRYPLGPNADGSFWLHQHNTFKAPRSECSVGLPLMRVMVFAGNAATMSATDVAV